MKLCKPYYEIWKQESGLEDVYKMIEKVGRVCYKSEDKIAEGTAKPFVDRLMKSGHGAMLEHGTVYLDFTEHVFEAMVRYLDNPYSKVYKSTLENDWDIPHCYVTTNYRVLVENNWLDDLKYICEPTEFHEKRITVRFIADIGVIREFFRHRTMSMAQESTRYCNYSKDKFNNELTFIIPLWCNIPENITPKQKSELWKNNNFIRERIFLMQCLVTENNYIKLISSGCKPQEARDILTLSIKSEAIMTGFVSDWKHFFDLRAIGTTGAPHPQAKELAEPLFEEFKAKGLIK